MNPECPTCQELNEACCDACAIRGHNALFYAIEHAVKDRNHRMTREDFLTAMEGVADDLALRRELRLRVVD